MLNKALDALSNQELKIVSKQTGVLICRFYMSTHTLENLYDSADDPFGIPTIQEHMPEYTIEHGFVAEDSMPAYRAFFDGMFRGQPSGQVNVRLRVRGEGEYRWHLARYSLVCDGERPLYALITFFDNTEERETELAAEKWRASLASVLSDALLYAEVNLSKNVVEQLDGQRLAAYAGLPVKTMEDIIPHGLPGTLSPEDEAEYFSFFDRQRLLGLFSAGVAEDTFDYSVTAEDGSPIWLRSSVSMMTYPHSGDVMAILSLTKLDGLQKNLEQLSHMAFHDALTGLLNRDGIQQQSSEALSHHPPQMHTALFMIDLDNFKQINDKLGHQVGDLVLRQVAEAIASAFHQTDVVGRLGGDEFIVLLTGDLSPRALEKKGLELLAATRLSHGDEQEIPISISIGIAFGQGCLTFDKLYQAADLALYSAKKAGKCRFHIINADTNEPVSLNRSAPACDLISLQTLLHQAEEGIPPAPTPYGTLLQHIPGSIVVVEVGAQVRIVHCNDWYCTYSGYTREELDTLQRRAPLSLVHPEDVSYLLEAFQSVRAGCNSLRLTYRIRCKDGICRPILFQGTVTERRRDMAIIHAIQTAAN